MYETQQAIFERLHDASLISGSAAAPTSSDVHNAPEAANWSREDGIDYRNYFVSRTNFWGTDTSHESAVKYCQKHRDTRNTPRL